MLILKESKTEEVGEKIMDAAILRRILEKEYGISNEEEFETAVKKSAGINLGIFTMPLDRSVNDEQKTKATNVA